MKDKPLKKVGWEETEQDPEEMGSAEFFCSAVIPECLSKIQQHPAHGLSVLVFSL